MGDFEIGEGDFEAVAVGTGGKHADFNGAVGFHPRIAHHVVVLVVEGIENLYRIEAAHGLNPDGINGTVKGQDAPVGGVVGDYCA